MKKTAEELLKNPVNNSILYYKNGWFGIRVWKNSMKNWLKYKFASKKQKRVYEDNLIDIKDYSKAEEELYLAGKLGLSVLMICLWIWLGFKIQRKKTVIEDRYNVEKLKMNDVKKTNSNIATEKKQLEGLRELFVKNGSDKNKFWIFDAGARFLGNPKWMFIYINEYRKDITVCWLTDSKDTEQLVRKMGYYAFCYGTYEAESVKDMAGVFVVENVKESIPVGLENVKILNLFHGVGCKPIERNQKNSYFNDRLAKKYIRYNDLYINNQLFLVTSPFIEKDVRFQCGIDKDKVVKAGYPRCMYQKYLEPIHTFERDLKEEKGLPSDTKLAIYSPTYRYTGVNYFFNKAIPSMENLNQKLSENNILLIMKFHPFMESDPEYILAKENQKKYSNIIFWNTENDFYEVMNQVDLAIVDYSSIFTDMVASGIKNFIRYIFDYEKEKDNLGLMYDYFEVTTGNICSSFEELLDGLEDYESKTDIEDLERIRDLYWEYDKETSFEDIVQKTLDFTIEKKELPILYSYDIFDTIFTRKVLQPVGIFYYVKEKMEQDIGANFPKVLVKDYPEIRKQCEANVRFRRIRHMQDDNDRREIYFDEIFENMQEVYEISDIQMQKLKEWELEAELDNVLPIQERVTEIKMHLVNGEDVVFISDMYLPKEYIRKMLVRVDKVLEHVPLFVSSEYGVQKTTKKLYLEVYNSFDFYGYKKWIHYGDNAFADQTQPAQMGIYTKPVEGYSFNEYETKLVEELGTYDAYLVAGMLARFRRSHKDIKDIYVHNYVFMYFVPYINYVLEHALSKGYKTLYFVARDGHHLKRIADELIKQYGYSIKTKYLYASRKTWRIPSFIDNVDEDFFGKYGAFVELTTMKQFLRAAVLDEELFEKFLPNAVEYLEKEELDAKSKNTLVEMLKESSDYRNYILKIAKEERIAVEGYLKQEMDFNEPYAIVEYWGRGYTQDCFVRIVNNIVQDKIDTPFYYVRSIDSSIGNSIKHNFTVNTQQLLFVEALFANMPYKSIEKYVCDADNHWKPVINAREYDIDLFNSMEMQLVSVCQDLHEISFINRQQILRQLFEFSLNYYAENSMDEMFVQCLSPLTDSVAINGDMMEFARNINGADVELIKNGSNSIANSRNVILSYARSNEQIKKEISAIYQGEENLFVNAKRLNAKQVSDSKVFEEKKNNFQKASMGMQKLYDTQVKKYKVRPYRLVILTPNYAAEEFYGLKKWLNKSKWIDSVIIELKTFKCNEEQMKELAQARYILTSTNMDILGMLTLRKETEVIQIMNFAFPYIKEGLSRKYKLDVEQKYMEEKLNCGYDYISLAAPSMTENIGEAYGITNKKAYQFFGSCITDVYFDSTYIKNAKKKLKTILPKEMSNKKIIAYMPLHRYRNGKCKYLNLLDMKRLVELLGNEYIILFMPEGVTRKEIAKEKINSPYIFDLGSQMTLREQFMVADVIVGDYRHSFFETALLDNPIFVTDVDAKTISDRQVYYTYDEVKLGVTVHNVDELADNIIHIEKYDFSLQRIFREKYLTNCDGNTGKRLVEWLDSKIKEELM